MAIQEQPLVSVIVVSYNSSDFVLETLESVKYLQYDNLELIVTDDASSDNTVAVCQEWMEANKSRFVNTKICVAEKNSGIPANCNRGLNASSGEWIKFIAADDFLEENAINNLLIDSDGKNLIAGNYQAFMDISGFRKKLDIRPTPEQSRFFDQDAEQQYQSLLFNPVNFAPSTFFRRAIFDKYGLFIERYFLLEDVPYWLTITSKGEKIYHTNHVVTYYRVGYESASMSAKNYYNIRFQEGYRQFKKEMVYPNIPSRNLVYFQSELVRYLRYLIIINLLANRNSFGSKVVNRLAHYLSLDAYFNAHKLFK